MYTYNTRHLERTVYVNSKRKSGGAVMCSEAIKAPTFVSDCRGWIESSRRTDLSKTSRHPEASRRCRTFARKITYSSSSSLCTYQNINRTLNNRQKLSKAEENTPSVQL